MLARELVQQLVGRVRLAGLVEQARAAGATIGREPATTFWGGYSAIFIDPDGHPWEVAHNPHWTIGPDGSITLPE